MTPYTCPTCGSGTHVTNTRQNASGIRRRRACVHLTCRGRITTLETVVPERQATDDYVLVSRKKLLAVAAHLADVLQEQVGVET